MGPDPWPDAPELPAPVIMDQRWTDAVFLHWRIPDAVAAPFMPPGVVPDSFDGSAWVGLIGFRMQGAGLGRGPGIPYFGSFNEINVRLYSREPDGTRGVVFLSLDATRLAVVLAARAAGIPYVWSRAGFRGAGALNGSHALRLPGTGCGGSGAARGATLRLRLRRSPTPKQPTRSPSTSPPGSVCTRASGAGPCMFPTPTAAWPLYRAQLTRCEDQLVAAAGISVAGPPESVLFSPGVRTQFGRPRVLR